MNENERNEQNEQEKMIKDSIAYLDALGLTASIEEFFVRDDVNRLIHEKYVELIRNVDEIIAKIETAEFPKDIIDSVREFASYLSENNEAEKNYGADVKCSVQYTLYDLFKRMEAFIQVDEQISSIFTNTFSQKKECDKQLMKSLEEICNGVKVGILKDISMLIFTEEFLGDIIMKSSVVDFEEIFKHDDKESDDETC